MSSVSKITEKQLQDLSVAVKAYMSEKRYRHTLGVEQAAIKLGEIYLPQFICELRAAALLHDITKELSAADQIAICEQNGIALTDADRLAPKTFHAKTAAAVIPMYFPEFATENILDAVRKHTTGARQMSLFAQLLYLADYIEEGRTFSDCVVLRNLFWSELREVKAAGGEQKDLLAVLDRVMLLSYDMTIRDLIKEEKILSLETVDARNALIEKISFI